MNRFHIQQDIVYQMIRRKSFDDARFRKSWLIIIDGTQLYSGRRKMKKNEIKKKQKNISSDLLESFGWHQTREDIFEETDMHSVSIN